MAEYDVKIVMSGKTVERYTYDRPVLYDFDRKPRLKKNHTKTYNKTSFARQRAKTKVRRLADANKFDRFVTLTFKNHITDLREANFLFTKFIKRLRYYFDVKYVAVPEFTKSGRVHYHMLLQSKYIRADKLAEIWGNGFIKINKIKNSKYVGLYISKYITKDLYSEALKNQKKFFTSKNLNQPIIILGIRAFMFWRDYLSRLVVEEFSTMFKPNEYVGRIFYYAYKFP